MKRIFRTLSMAIAWILLASPVLADPVPIDNHSFETPDLSGGGNTWTDVNQDWGDDAGASNDQFAELIDGFSSDGAQHVGINNADTDDTGEVEPLVQDLAATYQANTAYTLTVGVGNRVDFTFDGNESILRLADAMSGAILAESVIDASAIAAGTFEDRSLIYTTPASGDPVGNGIRIILGVGDLAGGRAHFDNVRLDATVIPEPSTLALLALSSLALGLVARRKQRG